MHPPFILAAGTVPGTVDPGEAIESLGSTPITASMPISCHHVEQKLVTWERVHFSQLFAHSDFKCHFIFTQAGAFTAEIIAFPLN